MKQMNNINYTNSTTWLPTLNVEQIEEPEPLLWPIDECETSTIDKAKRNVSQTRKNNRVRQPKDKEYLYSPIAKDDVFSKFFNPSQVPDITPVDSKIPCNTSIDVGNPDEVEEKSGLNDSNQCTTEEINHTKPISNVYNGSNILKTKCVNVNIGETQSPVIAVEAVIGKENNIFPNHIHSKQSKLETKTKQCDSEKNRTPKENKTKENDNCENTNAGANTTEGETTRPRENNVCDKNSSNIGMNKKEAEVPRSSDESKSEATHTDIFEQLHKEANKCRAKVYRERRLKKEGTKEQESQRVVQKEEEELSPLAFAAMLKCGSKNYYEILGIDPNSSGKCIMKHYRKLSIKTHPDRNKGPNATADFQALHKIYQTLKTPVKRIAYNARIGIRSKKQY